MSQSIAPLLSTSLPDPSRLHARTRARSDRATRLRLLGAIVVVFGLALVSAGSPRSANAVCSPDPPATGDTVTCTGPSTGFEAPVGVDDLTVNVEAGATLDESDPLIDAAVGVNDGTTVNVLSGATIDVTEVGGIGILAGDDYVIDIGGTVDVTADSGSGLSIGRITVTDPPSTDEALLDTTGLINVIGNDARGIEATDGAAIRQRGDINVLGTNSFGIDLGDSGILRSELGSTIAVTGSGGIGIFAGDDDIVVFEGRLDVMVDGGRGILTGGISDDTMTATTALDTNGIINLIGDNAIAMEATGDASVFQFGDINIEGSDSRGVVLGNRTIFTAANLLDFRGLIQIGDGTPSTANSIGIEIGDGWFPNDIDGDPTMPDFDETQLRNGSAILFGGSTLNVDSINGIGIKVGDDSNLAGNHNSVVTSAATINVSADDAVGVSLGGNDFAIPTDPLSTLPFSFRNNGDIVGTDNHGALIEFRNSSTGENRILNGIFGSIEANMALQGTPSRALAIVGTGGVERIDNRGVMRGNVLLGGGDDFFEQTAGSNPTSGGRARFEGNLDGGAGMDTLILRDNLTNTGLDDFDVSQLIDFEMIRVGGGNGWSLSNAAAFTGMTQVEPMGRLVAPTPLTLGGDLAVDRAGTVEVGLSALTPGLTIVGDATYDGTLVVDPDPDLVPDSDNPYLLIDVNGTRSGTFSTIDFLTASSFRVFTPMYMGSDLFVLFEAFGFVQDAQNSNQAAVARHLDQIVATGEAQGNLAQLLTNLENSTDPISGTLNALSPEAYDAQTSVVAESGRQITRTLFDRPRECRPGDPDPWAGTQTPLPCHPRSWSPWVATVGSFRSRDKFQGHPRYDAQIGGLIFGVDARPIGGLDLTLAIGSQRGSVDVAGAQSSTLTMTDVSGHAAYSYGPVRVQSAVSWGHGFHRDRRVVEYPDSNQRLVSVAAREDHDSDRISLAAEAGFQIEAGPIRIEPLVTLDWAWIYQRPISESDAGLIGLRVDRREDSIGSVSTGLRATTTYHHKTFILEGLEWMDGVWRPQLDLRWREFVAGTDRDIDARLRGAPTSVPDFRIEGQEDDGGFEIGAAVSFIPTNANRLQVDLRYEAFVASHTLEQDLSLRVQLGF